MVPCGTGLVRWPTLVMPCGMGLGEVALLYGAMWQWSDEVAHWLSATWHLGGAHLSVTHTWVGPTC